MSSAEEIAKAAKAAFEASQLIPSEERVAALHAIKRELEAKKNAILDANREDLQVRLSYLYANLHSD
jgi:glutamate-5-semialdehyde dehydrogenase